MKENDKSLKTATAAYLYAVRDRSQTEIAELLGVSQTGVSRMLNEARKTGVLRERLEFVEERVDLDVLRQVQQLAFGFDLRKPLERFTAYHRVHLNEVRIFYSGESDDDFEERLTRFGRAAAPFVLEQLGRASTVGLTWGVTLAKVLEGLRMFRGHFAQKDRQARFLPTSGEPLGSEVRPVSSSYLAREMDELLNGPRASGQPVCSLAGVPAILPIGYAKKRSEFQVIDGFIRSGKAYRRIFERTDENGAPHVPLIEEMDCLITSLGRSEKPFNMYDDELIVTGGIDRAELSRLILCDLGGVLIERPGLNDGQQKRVGEIAGLWTGLASEHVANCAEKARAGERPGVVVVAISAQKAEGLLACIRQGLVNSIIVDHHLAAGLVKLLESWRED